jgi:hypothetical protein
VNFVNLPTSAERAGGGAEAENNRASFWVEGFQYDPAVPVATVKVDQGSNVFHRPWLGAPGVPFRAKSGSPDAVARYLAAYLAKVVATVPPRFTHTARERGVVESRRRRAREAPEPVDDPFYIIQGLYSGPEAYLAGREFGFDDEQTALDEAKKLSRSPHFEGDYVRVLTRDGELVWDSRGGEPSGRGTWLLPPEMEEARQQQQWFRFRGVLVGAKNLPRIVENLKAMGARNIATSSYHRGEAPDVVAGEIAATSKSDAKGLLTAVLGYAPPKNVFSTSAY